MKCVSSRVFQQIIFGMLSTTVALTGLGAMSLQPALAANSVALPTVKTQQSASVTPSQATSSIQQSYGGLQGMWEAVYKLGDTAREASKQGTYWTPRADWLDYYSTTMAQAIAALEQEMNSTVFPADKQALVSDNWNQIRSILNDITTHYKDFADSIKGDQQTLLKAAFHGPAKAIAQDADKLDQLLITVNARISNHSGDSPIQAQQSTA
ncbi:MAG: hypothetical protein HY711_07760, partial [Candidatus Melainabacteria bacterium]|nr:hypothetical protein [Candidatus Melainabacteria bacterium]